MSVVTKRVTEREPSYSQSLRHIYPRYEFAHEAPRGAPIGAVAYCGHVKRLPPDPVLMSRTPRSEICVVCLELAGA